MLVAQIPRQVGQARVGQVPEVEVLQLAVEAEALDDPAAHGGEQ